MKYFQRIVSCVIAAAVALPAVAASSRQAIITPAEIAAAVNSFGIPIAPQQIELLANAVANTSHPQLRVQSVQRWENGKMMARLSCADAGQCVPFFVGLHVDQGVQPHAVAAFSTVAAAQPPARTPAVRSGMPATLFLDGDHIHIRLNVICLQSGTRGQTIRATDKDHRVVYTAQVTDNGILKGRL
jgi:hypothetical protein